MLEKILPYEENLFFLINGSHSYPVDCIMWVYSGGVVWFPIAIFIVSLLVYKKCWKEWLPILLAITLMFILCDQFSSSICKPYFARLRPTHYPGIEEYVRTLYGYTGGQYGFISGHATNAFGFAALTSLLFRNKHYTILIYIWAFIMAYSRVYLGVHFVSDVFVGAIVGVAIGFLVFALYRLYIGKREKTSINLRNGYKQRVKTMTIVIACYIPFFSIISEQLIYVSKMTIFQ